MELKKELEIRTRVVGSNQQDGLACCDSTACWGSVGNDAACSYSSARLGLLWPGRGWAGLKRAAAGRDHSAPGRAPTKVGTYSMRGSHAERWRGAIGSGATKAHRRQGLHHAAPWLTTRVPSNKS
jgi:hypothetical protein